MNRERSSKRYVEMEILPEKQSVLIDPILIMIIRFDFDLLSNAKYQMKCKTYFLLEFRSMDCKCSRLLSFSLLKYWNECVWFNSECFLSFYKKNKSLNINSNVFFFTDFFSSCEKICLNCELVSPSFSTLVLFYFFFYCFAGDDIGFL